jgi:hypothetical protein
MLVHEEFGLGPISFAEIFNSDEVQAIKGSLSESSPHLAKRLESLPPAAFRRVCNTPIGIEIEVEGAGGLNEWWENGYWHHVTDTSLRNEGVEFVTRVGYRAGKLLESIPKFCKWALRNNIAISDRTSIHVHLNMGNIGMDKLNNLVILYAMFEDVLFDASGSSYRKHNIFCVPWSKADLPTSNGLRHMVGNCHKYAALNLLPLTDRGTVEFRHMQTIFDSDAILNWIILLCLLRYYACRTDSAVLRKRIINLKGMEQYREFVQEIFFGFSDCVSNTPDTLNGLISDSKQYFFKD